METKTIIELISLKGKLAVITGAAQGIGLQIANRLAEMGANVAIADLNEEKAKQTASELAKKYAVTAKGYAVDISNVRKLEALVKAIGDDFGTIDILVNNAGVYPMMSLRDIKEKDFDFLMSINLKGVFMLSQFVSEHMITSKTPGKIINIASTAALKTAGNSAHYVASKHAIAGLTKSQAVELGQYGIKAITVAPTLVDTPGTQKLRENPDVDKGLKDFESRLPLQRMANPDDIAKTVAFAASGLSDYLTGILIPVDGGETAL
ncbi:SDR family oxidoreductase [Aquimarina sp. U1-2]|uniref:SDR family NAD(P)-dependent oxidoreductase n=1 Tax=Aquimarina sp. U1-2 TaxID=2823141 RepID=UPI001AECE855|nr:SDR family oxidoreductase [Aquimarina sp. U1-2]MBP2833095.1 SDR family oxidoreductase [Aquimarina sp. U1-2]